MPDGAASDAPALRQAALLVHALAPADRNWLIAALGQAHRSALAAPLDELKSLGIPRDARWLRSVLDAAPTPATDLSPAAALRHLSPLQLDALAAALACEPPHLGARLLAKDAWPWRAELLARCSPALRHAIEALPVPPAAAALDAALCALAWRTVSANLGTRARTRAGRWQTLLRLVRSMGREGARQ